MTGQSAMEQSAEHTGSNSGRLDSISILYEDNHMIVAVKPAGVLSQGDGSLKPDMLSLLKSDIKFRYDKPGNVFLGLVHRLDQPVAGVMVFARTSKAASRLSAQIREHRVDKFYLAVVHGCPMPRQGSLQDNLAKNPADGQVIVVAQDKGQAAWLDYRVLETSADEGLTLLAIRLGSGRGHQIRVQLSSRGWPIVGDRRYGGPAAMHEPRDPALFACLFCLDHPVSGKRLDFQALPPESQPWSLFRQPDLSQLPGLFLSKTERR